MNKHSRTCGAHSHLLLPKRQMKASQSSAACFIVAGSCVVIDSLAAAQTVVLRLIGSVAKLNADDCGSRFLALPHREGKLCGKNTKKKKKSIKDSASKTAIRYISDAPWVTTLHRASEHSQISNVEVSTPAALPLISAEEAGSTTS